MTARGARLREVAAYACDLAAFVVPLIVYIAGASHEPGAWDTAELQGVPYILGIAHPTGFPLYALLGYAWSHLLPFGSIAFRMNAMSAAAIAGAVFVAYALAVELGAPRLLALLASWWFALVNDVWQHAIRAETHDLALLLSAIAVYAMVRFVRGGGAGWFAAAFAAYGASLAAHPNALWVLPGLIAGALIAKRRPSWKLTLGGAALVVAGLSLYLYLPLRSAYVVAHGLDPAHVLGTAPGALFWNYNDPSTWAGLRAEVTGSEFGTTGFLFEAFNPAHYQDALWALLSGFGEQFGAFALLAIAFGFAGLWKRDWRTALVLLTCSSVALLFAVAYTYEADIGRYKLLAVWLGAPLLALAAPRSDDIAGGAGRIAYGIFLAAGIAIGFDAGLGNFDHAPGEGGRWIITQMRPLAPPGSVLITGWLDATSLAYGAYVDGSLPGRIVVGTHYPDALGLYREWARRRHVFLIADPTQDHIPASVARDVRNLDASHELYQIKPQP